jgi:hypothetical protein
VIRTTQKETLNKGRRYLSCAIYYKEVGACKFFGKENYPLGSNKGVKLIIIVNGLLTHVRMD